MTRRPWVSISYGGVLGVLGASILEAAFLRRPLGLAYLGVGLIEEAVKLAALWLLARRLPRYSMRDRIVLGAAVGFGFAAFESAGYAFNALFTTSGLAMSWRVPKGRQHRCTLPDQPWYLATTLADPHRAAAWCWHRGWVEPSFKDSKSRCFGLDRVQIGCPQRLSRLLVGLTIAL